MDPNRRIEQLERALSIERAEREAAQRRAATQAENTATWRDRAEQRSERIRRLEAERDQLRSVAGWLRHRSGRVRSRSRPEPRPEPPASTPDASKASGVPAPAAWKSFRSTLIATVGCTDPALAPLLDQFRVVDATHDPGALDRADLVVVDARRLRVGEGDAPPLDRWSDMGTGQRVLVIGGASLAIPGVRHRIDVDAEWDPASHDARSSWTIPTTFDPDRWSPAARSEADLPPDAVVGDHDGARAVIGGADFSVPWQVGAAAAGVPFLDGDAATPDEVARSAMALRRVVWRDHAPWVVASQVLDLAGIDHRRPMPRVTGILLSNRPDRIDGAIRSIARQRYPNFELLVGCHRVTTEDATRAAAEVADHLPVEVVAYSDDLSLGACLNDAIDRARGDVLAKIDDDDHYGPAYIEDAVHAMAYSGAELVSKGAVFTYLESADTTYLRKPSVVERFHSGSPNGASMVFTRSLWRRIGFPDRTIGEDVALAEAARSLGVLPYATSPWEFVYRRSVSGNTWDAVDEVFTEGSVVAWAGDAPERCEVPEP